MGSDNRVTASRRVKAPASEVFGLLSDPASHPEVDGSGMLVELVTPGALTGVGDIFTMRMHNDQMGEYTIDNHVVEFERDKRIVWEPVLSDASREDDKQYVGVRLHHQWGYQLETAGPDATIVTEFFDCSRSPEDFQQDLQGGSIWTRAIKTSLENIDQQLGKGETQ